MKVLLIYPPGVVLSRGGLWTQIQKTTESLRALGVDVTLFQSLEENDVNSFDLCHIIGAQLGTYHIARELQRRGIPYVVSPVFFSRHSPLFVDYALFLQNIITRFTPGLWIDYRFTSDICRWARAVLPNTGEEAQMIREGFGVPRGKITVVPNGADERFYEARPRLFQEKYGMMNFVLHVGYIDERRKNTLRLIKVLNRLNCDAVIIGGGSDPSFVETCRRLAAGNKRILMIEQMPSDSEFLASAYAACDVFVLPSLFETPGIAAMEASLAGAKIVITKYGGTKEYFREWAEYVEPTSEDSIAAGIQAALAKPKTSDLQEHIRNHFSWKSVGKRTLEVYKKVLS